MNSKIKSILLIVLTTLSFMTSSVSYAASLSVCGETTPPTATLENPSPTAYDNYKEYQTWLLAKENQPPKEPAPIKDLQHPTAEERAAWDSYNTAYTSYLQARSAEEQKLGICQASDLFRQIARIINFLIGFIGLFVIVRLVMSGFQMVLSQGSEEALGSAKKGMTNAIIGLVIVFAAYLIAQIIFQIAGVKGFNINPFA